MFLSKIWFVLVALLAGVGLTAAFVAPRPADRRIEQLEGQRLDRAQYAAEQMLKTDARTWMDYAATFGRDAVITESLDAASRGQGEPRVVSDTVKARLKALVPNLEGIGVESIAAVDARGRIVARIGDREGEAGDAVGGAEVVADALRGYLSDDAWGAGGKVQRVAAAPVLAKTRDRIVGALVIAVDSGKRLAEVWKRNLGVDVAVLLRGDVVASTVSEALLSSLPGKIDERAAEIAEHKRTRAISLPVGSDRMLAVAAPFAGQAAAQNAYYVLIGKQAPASNPWALLSSTTADDLKWGSFPWLGLGAAFLVMLGVGLYLQRYEMEGPLSRLRSEVSKLARGEVQKLGDTKYGGKFGGIARDVNAAMERFTLAPAARSETARKDMNAILDSGSAPEPKTFDLGPGSHFGALPPAGFTPAPTHPPFGGPAGPLPPPPAPFSPPSAPSLTSGPGALGSTPQARLSSPSLAPSGGRISSPPPPPPSSPTLGKLGAPGSSPLGRSAAGASGPIGLARQPEPPTPAVDNAPLAALSRRTPPSSPAFAQEMDAEPTGPMGQDEKSRGLDIDPEEAHMREVFAEYVATRQSTGESTAALTLDKFRAKLQANKEQLVAKYGCRTARFSVYVKDGKAAIKATPVRD